MWVVSAGSRPVVATPEKSSYQLPTGETTYGENWFKDQEERTKRAGALAATEGRDQSLAMQDYLRAAATGERSYAGEQTATNLAAMRAGVQSQLASSPWNPAARLGAGQAEGQAAAQIRTAGEAAASAEQDAAMRQYLSALEAERGIDTQARATIGAMAAKWRELGLSDREAMLKAQMEYEQDRLARAKIESGTWQQDQATAQKYFGSVLGGMGMAMGAVASDRTAKKNIKETREMLDHLKAYDYEYKDPDRFGRGKRTGVMAQDLEKSRLGKGMVHKTADGVRIVDYNPTTFNPIALAALADLNGRLKALEGGKR